MLTKSRGKLSFSLPLMVEYFPVFVGV